MPVPWYSECVSPYTVVPSDVHVAPIHSLSSYIAGSVLLCEFIITGLHRWVSVVRLVVVLRHTVWWLSTKLIVPFASRKARAG